MTDYVIEDVVTNTMVRERLLKGIADDLPMKVDFETWSKFLRETAQEMNDKGKRNEYNDQDPLPL